MVKICKINAPRSMCEDIKQDCEKCPYNSDCDYVWINALWVAENKQFGKDSLLGPAMPIFIKNDLRDNHIISITGKYDFCCFNVPKRKDVIVIGDIYVDEKARGQHISKQILDYLMTTHDRDIVAKCVRGTSAEDFWRHVGEQIDANPDTPIGHSLYEQRPGKRDLGWYVVKNKNKVQEKVDLF